MNGISRNNVALLFQCMASVMNENKGELERLDSLMGDGDLGLTMSRGYGMLPELLQELSDETDAGKVIAKSGMKFSSAVPSTMGFLMGSGLMNAGKKISGTELGGGRQLAEFLKGFAEGIVKRGKCAPGERTILDSVSPAAEAAEQLLQKKPEASFAETAAAAVQAAKQGVEATKQMIPKYGKAAVHKAAAAGLPDQGAVAGLYVMQAIQQFAETE